MLPIETVLQMSAEDIVRFISQQPIELSREKIKQQRDEYVKLCKLWRDNQE